MSSPRQQLVVSCRHWPLRTRTHTTKTQSSLKFGAHLETAMVCAAESYLNSCDEDDLHTWRVRGVLLARGARRASSTTQTSMDRIVFRPDNKGYEVDVLKQDTEMCHAGEQCCTLGRVKMKDHETPDIGWILIMEACFCCYRCFCRACFCARMRVAAGCLIRVTTTDYYDTRRLQCGSIESKTYHFSSYAVVAAHFTIDVTNWRKRWA